MDADKTRDPLDRIGKKTTLVVFGASWCTPYLLLQRVLDELESDGVPVRRVDIDAWPQHAEKFRVISLPTCVNVTGGAEKRRTLGAVGKAQLVKLLR